MLAAPAGADTRRAAFTLLELLAVIAVIGILTSIVIGVGRRATETARVARAHAELATVAAALESYRQIHGDYPQVAPDATAGATESGQALYAALNGQRGPAAGAAPFSVRQRALLDFARFALAEPAATATAVNHLLDPWGRPYHYAYKAPATGWTNTRFVLYSAGPDGEASPALLTGGYPDVAAAGNADNVYANQN